MGINQQNGVAATDSSQGQDQSISPSAAENIAKVGSGPTFSRIA
jgi:hypothetical protein